MVCRSFMIVSTVCGGVTGCLSGQRQGGGGGGERAARLQVMLAFTKCRVFLLRWQVIACVGTWHLTCLNTCLSLPFLPHSHFEVRISPLLNSSPLPSKRPTTYTTIISPPLTPSLNSRNRRRATHNHLYAPSHFLKTFHSLLDVSPPDVHTHASITTTPAHAAHTHPSVSRGYGVFLAAESLTRIRVSNFPQSGPANNLVH